MGMGAAPSNGYIINYDNLATIVPQELAKLEGLLEKSDMTLSDLAVSFYKEEELEDEEIGLAYDELLSAFTAATSVGGKGLELELFYYSDDDGDRYDDLEDGANWCVDGMTQLTPAGQKFSDKISFSMWTIYG